MGAGKTSVGRRLAKRLSLPFADADAEIEAAAGLSIAEIFERFGEAHFRDGERRVIARLIEGPRQVIATGGGAFMNDETRALILARCTTIWLDGDIDALGRARRSPRPPAAARRQGSARSACRARRDSQADLRAGPFPGPRRHRAARARRRPHPGLAGSGMIRIDLLPYPVLIGAGLIGEASLPPGRLFLVTDENVARAGWPERLRADFAGRFVMAPGEGSKSMATLERLLDAMIDAGIGRGDHVVALGGGVVGDLAGFAAAVLKRGCAWIAVPTTLLGQADSAVGGKTGIDARQGKNLIGAFHPPALVLIDPGTLATLPEAELRAGYAEVVKYGLIGDPGFFAWCEAHGAALLDGDEAARRHAIETCVRAKAGYVLGDEEDRTGRRALLNFGHSFGHAIEAETGMQAWRGRGHRHGDGLSPLGRARPLPRRRRRAGDRPSRGGGPADAHRPRPVPPRRPHGP